MNSSSGRQRGVIEEEEGKRKVKGMGSKHICCPNEIRRTIIDHEENWPAGSSIFFYYFYFFLLLAHNSSTLDERNSTILSTENTVAQVVHLLQTIKFRPLRFFETFE